MSYNILNKIVTKLKFQNLYFRIFQPSVFSEFQSRKKKCRRVRGLEVQRRQRCESWPGQLGYMGARVVILTPTTIFVCFCIFVFLYICKSVSFYFCILHLQCGQACIHNILRARTGQLLMTHRVMISDFVSYQYPVYSSGL